MKKYYHPSWVRWDLTVDPVEIGAREFDQKIRDTSTVAWYFDLNPEYGLLYIHKRIDFDTALRHAKDFREILSITKENMSIPGNS